MKREEVEGRGGGAMRAEEPPGGSLDAGGASHFQTSLRRICFVSLTRNTPAW